MRRTALLAAPIAVLLPLQVVAVERVSTPSHRIEAQDSPAPLAARPALARAVRLPKPVPAVNPDPHTRSGNLIEISIKTQTLTAWHEGSVVMRFLISTGQSGYETPTGRYHVYYKTPKGWSSTWRVWMPWAMAWNGNYMIHELPHFPGSTQRIGASTLGKPASHGCIRVGVGNAERLYRWAAVGTPVWVH